MPNDGETTTGSIAELQFVDGGGLGVDRAVGGAQQHREIRLLDVEPRLGGAVGGQSGDRRAAVDQHPPRRPAEMRGDPEMPVMRHADAGFLAGDLLGRRIECLHEAPDMRVHPPALVDQHREHEDEAEQDREIHYPADDRHAAQHPGEHHHAEQQREGREMGGKMGEIGHKRGQTERGRRADPVAARLYIA